jgi:hypothetical protein
VPIQILSFGWSVLSDDDQLAYAAASRLRAGQGEERRRGPAISRAAGTVLARDRITRRQDG